MSKKVNPLTKKVIERINELQKIYKESGCRSFREFLLKNLKRDTSKFVHSYPPKKNLILFWSILVEKLKITKFVQKEKYELNEFLKHVEEIEPILRVEDAERWISVSKILKKYDYNDIELYTSWGASTIKLIIDTYFKEILI